MARPSSVPRSRPMLRFPRLECSSRTCTTPERFTTPVLARPRMASPRSTCSTLTTSAPQSARTADAAGTNVCSATSRMRIPLITSVIGGSSSCSLLNVESRYSGVELDLKRVQRHSDHVIVADDHHDLDELLLVVAVRQLPPRPLAQAGLGVELVRGPKEQGVGVSPAERARAILHAADLLIGETSPAADDDMLSPFVLARAVPTGAKNEDLTVPAGQLPVEQRLEQGSPRAEEVGMAHERREDIRTPVGDRAVDLDPRQLGGRVPQRLPGCGERAR